MINWSMWLHGYVLPNLVISISLVLICLVLSPIYLAFLIARKNYRFNKELRKRQ